MQKNDKIKIRRMHSQKTAQAQVLEQDTSRGGSEFGRGGTGRSTEGSDNSADLFTKALEHDSIVRHTEAMGCECMFGRDPIALTVRILNAKVNMENFAQEVEYRSKTSGRMDAWTRMDLRRDHVDEFEGAMSNAKREAPIEFWKTEEAVPENLGRSRENRLAEKGELEARRRSLSQPEPDRSALATKCQDEDEAAKIESMNVWTMLI